MKSWSAPTTKRVVLFSDTHNQHKYITLPECDIAIFSGDYGGRSGKTDTVNFLEWYSKQHQCTHKVFIPGNHDLAFDPVHNKETKANEWLDEIMKEYFHDTDFGKIVYLHNEMKIVDDLAIYGSPVTPDFHPQYWAFNKSRGETIMKVWKKIPEQVDIIVTHGPVHGMHDYVPRSQEYTGCQALKEIVELRKPILHTCGHIHEGYGIAEKNGIWYANASICTADYKPINKPIEVDIDIANNKITGFRN